MPENQSVLGTGIAADDKVKLFVATEDSVDPIPSSATTGLYVDVRSLSALVAGETHIGAVGGHGAIITVTPTLTVGATYVANDFVGTSATAMTFTGCARANGGTYEHDNQCW